MASTVNSGIAGGGGETVCSVAAPSAQQGSRERHSQRRGKQAHLDRHRLQARGGMERALSRNIRTGASAPFRFRPDPVAGPRGALAMQLARISHRPSTTHADLLAVSGRTPCSRRDVVSATPSPSSGPCPPSQRHLGALATNGGERCGLVSLNGISLLRCPRVDA